jgi:hypothetical protein
MQKVTEISPAYNREAEQTVLGCAIVEPQPVLSSLLKEEMLQPQHFYFRAHRLIYQTLIELYEQNQPIDLITLGNRLEEKGVLAEIGGRAYLSELLSCVTTTTSAGYYANIVAEKARQRELEQKAAEFHEAVTRTDAKAQERLLRELQVLSHLDESENGVADRDLISFPADIIDGLAGQFADLYAANTEVPQSFLFMAFLAYMGHALCYKVTMDSELTPQPRFYLVLVGPSSDARKSTALDITDKFFREAVPEHVKTHYGLGSAEGMAQELEADRPVALMLHLDELKILVDKCSQKGSVALPLITSLFDRNVFDNRTKGSKLQLRDAHLSLVAACTTETYQTMFSPAFRDIGLINRLFIVHDQSRKRIFAPRLVDQGRKSAIQRELATLVGAVDAVYKGQGQMRLSLSPEADALLQAWYEQLEHSVHTRRLEAYALRLAILLALNTGDTKRISKDVAENVVKLLNYELAVRSLFDPVDADNTIAAMEERIRRALSRNAMTERELRNFTNAKRHGLWAFNAAKSNLLEAGEIGYSSAKRRYYPTRDSAEANGA